VYLPELRSLFDRAWRESAEGFIARCPAHDDREPSLKVSAGKDGRILLYCHAGCTPEAVVAALGLTMSDLFEARVNGRGTSSSKIEEAVYDYTDENGKLLFQVVRYKNPKKFSFRHPDGNGGWMEPARRAAGHLSPARSSTERPGLDSGRREVLRSSGSDRLRRHD
jgi:hypothetical protein